MLLGARHVPERLCGGYAYLGRYIKYSTFTFTFYKSHLHSAEYQERRLCCSSAECHSTCETWETSGTQDHQSDLQHHHNSLSSLLYLSHTASHVSLQPQGPSRGKYLLTFMRARWPTKTVLNDIILNCNLKSSFSTVFYARNKGPPKLLYTFTGCSRPSTLIMCTFCFVILKHINNT